MIDQFLCDAVFSLPDRRSSGDSVSEIVCVCVCVCVDFFAQLNSTQQGGTGGAAMGAGVPIWLKFSQYGRCGMCVSYGRCGICGRCGNLW